MCKFSNEEAKEFLREFLKDRPNFREEYPGQDEEVYRQMDRLTEALDMAIEALGKDTDVPTTDLIRRQAAIDALGWGNEWDMMGLTVIDKDDAIRQIKSLPAAQPERKTGKWNTYYHGDTDFTYSCNRCGYSAPYQMIGGEVFQKKWDFCPNCGAKMEEGTA